MESKEKVKLLEGMKGKGKMTWLTILTRLPELGRVSNKEIASLVGVAPFSDESGKRKGRRETKGGRKEVRRALYMATLAAIRFNAVIRRYYQGLVSCGKAKKVAIVACIRKVVVILNAKVRERRAFKAGEDSHVVTSHPAS